MEGRGFLFFVFLRDLRAFVVHLVTFLMMVTTATERLSDACSA